MGKLVTIEMAAECCVRVKSSGKKLVLCHGVWDWLHPGHYKHLKAAKGEGDFLIVTVTPDRYVNKGPGRPIYSEDMRAEVLCDLECVDMVAINKWPTAVETIRLLKPDVYVKGSDYAPGKEDVTGGFASEESAVKDVGGRIHFTNEVTFSSTENINRYCNPYPPAARLFLEGFRKSCTAGDIIDALKALKKLRVLVVGEAVIDEYQYCEGLGKTSKDNMIAVKYLNEEKFAGGVLIMANHLAGFCRSVDLVTCLGNGYDYAPFILGQLKPNVRAKFFHNPEGPTIIKRRFVDPAFMTKMFEVQYLNEEQPKWLDDQISDYLTQALSSNSYDMVIVLDYGHGVISSSLAHQITDSGLFVAVNTQTNTANRGFNVITKYPRADYISLDEPELRLACRDKAGDIKNLVIDISKRLGCTAIAITQGHEGCLVYNGDNFYKIPALVEHALDRMGAGDTYLSITAPCVANGIMIEVAGFIGNAAAALKIQTVGNREAISPPTLYKFIQTLLK